MARKLSITDWRDAVGDGVSGAVADHLEIIEADSSILQLDNFKFVSESIIATGSVDHASARALNGRLCDLLFGPTLDIALVRNPLSVAMYALPLLFAIEVPPARDRIAEEFLALHAAGAIAIPSYPAYRHTELDWIATRLSHGNSSIDPIGPFINNFLWLTRDHIYALTHLHFYRTMFGRVSIDLDVQAIALIDCLIARAHGDDDIDLMFELIMCYATTRKHDQEQARFYDALVAANLPRLIDRSGQLSNQSFAETYHPLLVAWMLLERRGARFDPKSAKDRMNRFDRLSAVMAAPPKGDSLGFFASYAAVIEHDGPHPLIDPLFDRHGQRFARTVELRC